MGRRRHPVLVFFGALAIGTALLAVCSVLAGLLSVDVIGHLPVIGAANDGFDRWLARHRTSPLTEASLIGSIGAGGVVLPIVAGATGALATLRRKWRIAAFAVFALVVESAAYRATTLVFPEHRPRVHRLENLLVDASYPSGHTAELGVVTAAGPFQWTRTIARAVVGSASQSPFVRVTKAKSVKAELSRKVPYELDGGARKKVKRFSVEVDPGVVSVCVPQTFSLDFAARERLAG